MSSTASPTTVAIMVALAGTFAIVGYAFLWAVTSSRPVRPHIRVPGRAAFA